MKCISLLTIVLLQTLLLVAPQARGSDVKEQISFTATWDAQQYADRSRTLADARAELRRLAATKQPSEGARIARLVPNGKAEGLGIDVGDIISKVGDDVVWTTELDLDPDADERVFDVYDQSAGRLRTYRVDGPRIGVYFTEYWSPGLRYLRDETLRGKWDDHVLNAAVTFETDPSFAEEALSRAMNEGCTLPPIVAEIAIVVSLGRNLPERAAALLDQLKWEDDAAAASLHPVVALRAAIANNRLKLASRIVSFSPLTFRFDSEIFSYLQELDENSRKASSEADARVSPSQAVQSLYRDDLIPRLSGQSFYSVRNLVPALKQGKAYSLDIESGKYHSYFFGVDYPINDLDYSATFTLKPSTGADDNLDTQIVLGLYRDDIVDPENTDGQSSSILGLRVGKIIDDPDHSATVEINLFGHAVRIPFSQRTIKVDGQQDINVRILRVGFLYEIQLNGNRVLLLPIAEECSLFAGIQIGGASSTLKRVEFNEWIPRSE